MGEEQQQGGEGVASSDDALASAHAIPTELGPVGRDIVGQLHPIGSPASAPPAPCSSPGRGPQRFAGSIKTSYQARPPLLESVGPASVGITVPAVAYTSRYRMSVVTPTHSTMCTSLVTVIMISEPPAPVRLPRPLLFGPTATPRVVQREGAVNELVQRVKGAHVPVLAVMSGAASPSIAKVMSVSWLSFIMKTISTNTQVTNRHSTIATHPCPWCAAPLPCVAPRMHWGLLQAEQVGNDWPCGPFARQGASEPLAATGLRHLGVAGSPSRWGGAADRDRVDIHQPPPRGGIGGSLQLRRRSGTPTVRLGILRTRHQAAGIAALRHRAGYSLANPWAGARLGSASATRAHSFRGAMARGHSAPPRVRVRVEVGHGATWAARPPPFVNDTASAHLVSPLTTSIDTLRDDAAILALVFVIAPRSVHAALQLHWVDATLSHIIVAASFPQLGTSGSGPARIREIPSIFLTCASPKSSTILGVSSNASGRRSATDSDRVGHHQPMPVGIIGGPRQLRDRRGAPTSQHGTLRARHQCSGAVTLRHHAGSSCGNPSTGGKLAADSPAKTDSLRAVEARGRSVPPR